MRRAEERQPRLAANPRQRLAVGDGDAHRPDAVLLSRAFCANADLFPSLKSLHGHSDNAQASRLDSEQRRHLCPRARYPAAPAGSAPPAASQTATQSPGAGTSRPHPPRSAAPACAADARAQSYPRGRALPKPRPERRPGERSQHPELASPLKRCLGALATVSWAWAPSWGSLEPPRRDGENAQKTGGNGEEMGEMRSKTCK